ncbi:MAG: DUF1576 domain-containing protein [Oscillospiraceae bacterium]|nr:DUF1576 domain-containing protein [Oscillospiraceae bacterium]
MKRVKNMSEGNFLRLFFTFVSVCFIVAAFFMPDRNTMFTGLWNIMSQTCKISTNYFALGGYAATFLNMGLVGLFCTLLVCLPGAKPNNVTTLGVLLTIGFGSWGINVLNAIPTVLGVFLYAAVKKEKLGAVSNAMLYSTGIAPLISDLLFRYPGIDYIGFNWLGLGLALFIGLVIGFFLPAGLGHAPNIHKGYDHYSAAVPIGMTAFFLRAALYNVMLGTTPAKQGLSTMAAPDVTLQLGANIFCIAVFVLCIVFALLMGCKIKDYWALLKDSGHGVSFSAKYGYAPFLMNVGVFGLMIIAYFNLAGLIDGKDVWTGMTFGIVFCMLATCNSGSHPGNVWPIMAGYMIASFLFGWIYKLLGGTEAYALTIGNQSILIGLCYANGMSPISGKYGFGYGILAGGLHYLLVTAVPDMHGGFCLYNGGFTAALICLLFIPQLEKFCKTKEERRLAKAAK